MGQDEEGDILGRAATISDIRFDRVVLAGGELSGDCLKHLRIAVVHDELSRFEAEGIVRIERLAPEDELNLSAKLLEWWEVFQVILAINVREKADLMIPR
jgi:hypothetical protein